MNVSYCVLSWFENYFSGLWYDWCNKFLWRWNPRMIRSDWLSDPDGINKTNGWYNNCEKWQCFCLLLRRFYTNSNCLILGNNEMKALKLTYPIQVHANLNSHWFGRTLPLREDFRAVVNPSIRLNHKSHRIRWWAIHYRRFNPQSSRLCFVL